jgi:hypothetical protein
MGRINQDLLSAFRVDPSGRRPAARENKHMNFAFLDYGQLQIAIEWRV